MKSVYEVGAVAEIKVKLFPMQSIGSKSGGSLSFIYCKLLFDTFTDATLRWYQLSRIGEETYPLFCSKQASTVRWLPLGSCQGPSEFLKDHLNHFN